MDGLMVGILSILIDVFVWCVKLAVSIVAVGSVTGSPRPRSPVIINPGKPVLPMPRSMEKRPATGLG